MTTEHTVLPWKASHDTWDGTPFWTITDESGAVICQEPTGFSAYASGAFISPDGIEANRDFIVTAVNAHADLVAACWEALSVLKDMCPPCPEHECGTPNAACDGGCVDYVAHCRLLSRIDAALAKAGAA